LFGVVSFRFESRSAHDASACYRFDLVNSAIISRLFAAIN